MKVTVNGLKQYVDFDWSLKELIENLTMLGLEVEGVEKIGGGYEGIVVAEVIESKPHPDADKLSVCQVHDGTGQRQIVCGAKNFKVGDKVPLILPGHSLPPKEGQKPFTIKVGKLRGVESCGMMCSGSELGLSQDHNGLMILDEAAHPGTPLATYLGCSEEDTLLDLEVTPNRPDYNSFIGIAREIAALTGNPLRWPEINLEETAAEAESQVNVRIEDPEKCPRYQARLIRGVQVGPSPSWLKRSLEACGIRSINNVVDVTNFVMMEIGQPLHAFDYHLIQSKEGTVPTLLVRTAQPGETFTTLDAREHALDEEMLLIADETRGIALAGVMGGLNSEINDQTTDVLIESACFKPESVRRTAKKLDCRTDASYRFERGSDPDICNWASRRAAQLILQTAGGTLCKGVVETYPGQKDPKVLALRFHKTNQLLGIALEPERQIALLESLELKCLQQDADSCQMQCPSWRVDLKGEIDLIEEITRLYGVNRIPSTPPRGAHGNHPYDAIHDLLAEARALLTGLGLYETQGQTLIAEAAAQRVASEVVALEYPLSADMNVLRPSLLPGLLDVLQHNINHRVNDLALFEIGRVFLQEKDAHIEARRLSMAWTGKIESSFWKEGFKGRSLDIFDAKGTIEVFLDQFGMRGLGWRHEACTSTDFMVEKGSLILGKHVLGSLGQLHPGIAKEYDIKSEVFLCELDLDRLLSMRVRQRSFKALPTFPSIRRDLAMLVSEETTHAEIEKTIRKAKPVHLESVDVFDMFRGEHVPQGKKSLGYSLTYRSTEKTLTDKEVEQDHAKVLAALQGQLGAEMR